MSAVPASQDPDRLHDVRKRAVRRTALWLAVLAAAFYFAFIAMAVVKGS